MKRKFKKEKGQAVVEYIIIVVIVSVAAFVVLGAFSDRLKGMIAGATTTLGGTPEGHDERSVDQAQGMDDTGMDISGG